MSSEAESARELNLAAYLAAHPELDPQRVSAEFDAAGNVLGHVVVDDPPGFFVSNAAGDVIVHEPTEPLPDVRHEYAVFNDEEFFGPLFECGMVPEAQRFLVEDPLYTSASLWSAYKHAKNTEFDRQAQGKLEEYGKPVVRAREVITTPWADVPPEEIEKVRR